MEKIIQDYLINHKKELTTSSDIKIAKKRRKNQLRIFSKNIQRDVDKNWRKLIKYPGINNITKKHRSIQIFNQLYSLNTLKSLLFYVGFALFCYFTQTFSAILLMILAPLFGYNIDFEVLYYNYAIIVTIALFILSVLLVHRICVHFIKKVLVRAIAQQKYRNTFNYTGSF